MRIRAIITASIICLLSVVCSVAGYLKNFQKERVLAQEISAELKKEHKTNKHTHDISMNTLVLFVQWGKYVLQCAIGAAIIVLAVIETIKSPDISGMRNLLEMASIGLTASAVIELGYMLFTPGPDEAVEPIITGIAAFILYELSKESIEFNIGYSVSIGVLVVAIVCLFWVKKTFIDSKKDEDNKKEKIRSKQGID